MRQDSQIKHSFSRSISKTSEISMTSNNPEESNSTNKMDETVKAPPMIKEETTELSKHFSKFKLIRI